MSSVGVAVAVEALATLRRRLAALPNRHPERKALLLSTADLALSRWGRLAGGRRSAQAVGMGQRPDTPHGHRFPRRIISHAIWLHHVFSLSLRDVELLLAERGVTVSYETIRRWCLSFGQDVADRLRRRRPKPGQAWHLDEVFLRINGEQHYLWRAVDQPGVLLDNRAENSHRPTRRRERQMQRFKSSDQAQRFLCAHGSIYGHLRPRCHLMTAHDHRRSRGKALRIWQQETCAHSTR